ncbi:ATP-binding protein [Actinokineospora terrae]|uniref:Sensor-like histidine kinase SenX3 n=1 Tax=Actinokineospora terrae TaxID=155974 RepID=A0A1H9X3P2_9PSEU|nr:ATP-binding protein [Actinokineospora terrae]SES40806.1 PAS domain-containing protein [Actinokineospora terrae]
MRLRGTRFTRTPTPSPDSVLSYPLARTAAFTALYVVATVAGRLTVLDQTSLSLVWPAAGVAVMWFCAQRGVADLRVDVVAFAVTTIVVNMLTNASAGQAVVFVVSNLAQVSVFVVLITRWRPALWSLRPEGGLQGPRDLWRVLAAAYLAASTGAVLGTAGLWLVTRHFSIITVAVWMARNFAGMLVVGLAGLCVARTVATRWAARRDPSATCGGAAIPAECALVILCSVGAYAVGLGTTHGLPVASTLIALTVWAAVRLPTTFVALHTLSVAIVAVLFTLNGDGPFAAVESTAVRALVVQLFVTVVAVIGFALALSRDERDTLVRQLALETDETNRRAALTRAIIDSMADGLSVVDAEGRVTLRNPAALRLLGGRISPDDTVVDSSHYGFFHLDGTPLSAAEMPHVRLASGEQVEQADVLVRNPGVPDGRIINVRTTALPDQQGGHNAVVLFHDVTAERRHRDELAAFAGVVAHDLLNPLTAAEGWTDDADEALQDAPGGPMVDRARQGLVRVKRSTGRMRGLINDLLAYTTARDAAIAPTHVDLSELATDIAAARSDSAAAAGLPVPVFTIGALPVVNADAVLIRQLLDNLIGNAVKYTAPGTVANVDITSEVRGDLVHVTIADNGIGIPPGQHEIIFDNFHRAHRHTTHTGTGLGLAICKRVVERHGGTITATDNPTGGALFTFTLPTAWSTTTHHGPLPQPIAADR